MSAINPQSTLAELVVERSDRSRFFEHMGLDFCCGGKQTLAQACADKGLDVNTVTQALSAVEAMGQGAQAHNDSTDWNKASLTDLANHIEHTHHAYLWDELPRIEFLLEKIDNVHGGRHSELHSVKDVFGGLKAELESHLQKEEQVLFPAIRQLEASRNSSAMPIHAPISVMEQEHDSAGKALESLRSLTHNYTVPADGCGTYRATYEALVEMEKDLHQHIHKENNILFPRARALQD